MPRLVAPLLLLVTSGCSVPFYPTVKPKAAYELPVSVVVLPPEPTTAVPDEVDAAAALDVQRLVRGAVDAGGLRGVDGAAVVAPVAVDETAVSPPVDPVQAARCAAGTERDAPVVLRNQLVASAYEHSECADWETYGPSWLERLSAKHPDQLSETRVCVEHGPAKGVMVTVAGTLTALDSRTCEVLGELQVKAEELGGFAAAEIRATAIAAEAEAVAQIRGWLRATVFARTPVQGRGARAIMARGTADGVAPGASYAVVRGDEVTHHLEVARVDGGSAELALIDGEADLRDGDEVYTSGGGWRIVAAPLLSLRHRAVGGDREAAVSGGLHVGFYGRGRGVNLDVDAAYELGWLGRDATNVAGVAVGPRYELIPRWLVVRARAGVGLVWITDVSDPDMPAPPTRDVEPWHAGFYVGATAGAELHLGRHLWLAADAGYQRSSTLSGYAPGYTSYALDGLVVSGSIFYERPTGL